MRSPADMKVIQIDITNACMFSCSNCTRFCGHHAKPFFMDLDTFRRAVDSMAGFKGTIGIMGGEPTLHPEFDKFIDYYACKIPEPRPSTFIQQPVTSFAEYASVIKYQRGRRRGLWSSLGNGYYNNFEQIQDVFPYQNVNDHQSINTHQAMMITRKELGIPDEEWFKLRDNCWIQNLWSASITPKGAFFCEIAAALDMLFDGPGGWPIEPGWWKRKPAEFADQLHWCEMCSAALRVPTMDASRQTDIVSPAMLEKLKATNDPKVRKNRFVIFDPTGYDPGKYCGHDADPIWYFPKHKGDSARVSPTHGTQFPRRVEVAVLNGVSPAATLSLERLEKLDFTDWVAVFPNDAAVNREFLDRIPKCVLNPGCFYHNGGTAWLFNRRARALRALDSIKFGRDLMSRWEPRKQVRLKPYPSIGELSLWGKLRLLIKQARNRGAFVLPVFSVRERTRCDSSVNKGTVETSAGECASAGSTRT